MNINHAPAPATVHPTKTDAVRAMRAEGHSNAAIASALGIPTKSVSALVPTNPRPSRVGEGRDIESRFNLCVGLNIEIRQMLRPHAAKRNMSVETLIISLIERIAEDGIVNAVMDDGVNS